MEEPEDAGETVAGADAELQQVLGLYDVPAFARRGQELEQTLVHLAERCRRERNAMLDMVRLRLRQWASLADGPEAWQSVFTASIESLWPLSDAPPPQWGSRANHRRLLAVGRDLIASVERFNRRWAEHMESLNFERINYLIEQYNRYYLLEKECILSSTRLAARFFTPKPLITAEGLLEHHPTLPVPQMLE